VLLQSWLRVKVIPAIKRRPDIVSAPDRLICVRRFRPLRTVCEFLPGNIAPICVAQPESGVPVPGHSEVRVRAVQHGTERARVVTPAHLVSPSLIAVVQRDDVLKRASLVC